MGGMSRRKAKKIARAKEDKPEKLSKHSKERAPALDDYFLIYTLGDISVFNYSPAEIEAKGETKVTKIKDGTTQLRNTFLNNITAFNNQEMDTYINNRRTLMKTNTFSINKEELSDLLETDALKDFGSHSKLIKGKFQILKFLKKEGAQHLLPEIEYAMLYKKKEIARKINSRISENKKAEYKRKLLAGEIQRAPTRINTIDEDPRYSETEKAYYKHKSRERFYDKNGKVKERRSGIEKGERELTLIYDKKTKRNYIGTSTLNPIPEKGNNNKVVLDDAVMILHRENSFTNGQYEWKGWTFNNDPQHTLAYIPKDTMKIAVYDKRAKEKRSIHQRYEVIKGKEQVLASRRLSDAGREALEYLFDYSKEEQNIFKDLILQTLPNEFIDKGPLVGLIDEDYEEAMRNITTQKEEKEVRLPEQAKARAIRNEFGRLTGTYSFTMK